MAQALSAVHVRSRERSWGRFLPHHLLACAAVDLAVGDLALPGLLGPIGILKVTTLHATAASVVLMAAIPAWESFKK